VATEKKLRKEKYGGRASEERIWERDPEKKVRGKGYGKGIRGRHTG
jgi:hypothetical protein